MNSLIFGVDCITSKSNSTVVKIAKLQDKKFRNDNKLFLCDGVKLFLEAIEFGAKIEYIVINEKSSFDEKIVSQIKNCQENGVKILCVNDAVFEKMTVEKAPQGIITVCTFLDKIHAFSTTVKNCNPDTKLIVLESIRDPGNMGTILRNSTAFGIDKLVLSSDCADIYSPKVIRATMGAIFKVDICISNNLVETIEDLRKKGKRIISTTLNEKSLVLGKDRISSEDVIIIGNEGHGISQKIIDISDETLFIPMQKNTESLNAATATSIIMWELSK